MAVGDLIGKVVRFNPGPGNALGMVIGDNDDVNVRVLVNTERVSGDRVVYAETYDALKSAVTAIPDSAPCTPPAPPGGDLAGRFVRFNPGSGSQVGIVVGDDGGANVVVMANTERVSGDRITYAERYTVARSSLDVLTDAVEVCGPDVGVGTVSFLSTDVVSTNRDVAFAFAPKAAIVIANGVAFGATSASGDLYWSYGVTDGTNHRCVLLSIRDGVGHFGEGSHLGDAVLGTMDWLTVTVNGKLTASFSGNNVRLTVSDQLPANIDVTVIAFGGPNVQAAVGDFTIAHAGTPGSASKTGLAFQPTALLTLGYGAAGPLPVVSGSGLANTGFAITHDVHGLSQGCASLITTTGTDAGHSLQVAEFWARMSSGTVVNGRSSLTAFTSDGWNYNRLESPGGDQLVSYLALAGVKGRLLTGSTATNLTPFQLATGSMTPQAALVVGSIDNLQGSDVAADHAALSVGFAAADDDDQHAISLYDRDAVALAELFRANLTFDEGVYVQTTEAAVDAKMKVSAWLASAIEFTMTDADDLATNFLALAIES